MYIYVSICKYMPSCSMLTWSSGRSLNAAQRPWQISNLCVKRKITNPTPSTSICNLIFQFPKKSGSRKKKCAPKLRIRYDRISAIVVYCFANCFFLYTSFRATYASIRYELFGAHRSFHLSRGTCLTHRLSNNACHPECTNKPTKTNLKHNFFKTQNLFISHCLVNLSPVECIAVAACSLQPTLNCIYVYMYVADFWSVSSTSATCCGCYRLWIFEDILGLVEQIEWHWTKGLWSVLRNNSVLWHC